MSVNVWKEWRKKQTVTDTRISKALGDTLLSAIIILHKITVFLNLHVHLEYGSICFAQPHALIRSGDFPHRQQ